MVFIRIQVMMYRELGAKSPKRCKPMGPTISSCKYANPHSATRQTLILSTKLLSTLWFSLRFLATMVSGKKTVRYTQIYACSCLYIHRSLPVFTCAFFILCFCNFLEEDSWEHQQSAGSCDEEWKIHSWLQNRPWISQELQR